eukprot:scaffold65193_cov41-Attheya_sp.AAC.4
MWSKSLQQSEIEKVNQAAFDPFLFMGQPCQPCQPPPTHHHCFHHHTTAASSKTTPSIHMGETGVPAEGAEVTAVATTTTCERCVFSSHTTWWIL